MNGSDRAQSEVIGVILLVGVVTITIGGAGAVYLSTVADESGPATDVRVTVTDDAVALTHNGGSALSMDSLRVVVRRNGSDTGTDWSDGAPVGDGDDRFEPAEKWRQDGFAFDSADRIEVLLVHEPSGTLLVREVVNPTVRGGGGTATTTTSTATPTASFDVTPDPVERGESVTVDASDSSGDGSIDTYEWDWTNDGTFEATGATATHTYDSVGSKTIRLRVTDGDDETDTTTRTVRVDPAVRLTAVQPDPERRSDSAIEFVRVTVPESTDTTDWTISDDDGSGQVTTFPSEQLSGDYYFARNPEVFAETWHLDSSRVFDLKTKLNNGGETLRLRNGDGAVVDEFAYEGATTSDGWSVGVETGEVAVRKSVDGSYTDTNGASDWRVRDENAFHTMEAGPVPDAGVAYVDSTDNNYLEAVDAQGRVAFYDVVSPPYVGPKRANLDGDDRLETPYFDSNGNISIIDHAGDSSVFVESSEVQSGTTRIGVGDLDGDGTPAVFFRDGNNDISAKEVDGSIRVFRYSPGGGNGNSGNNGNGNSGNNGNGNSGNNGNGNSGNNGNGNSGNNGNGRALRGYAVAGVTDFDGDGNMDLVYVESRDNDELAYFDSSAGDRTSLGVKPASVNAIGSPADYDGDGKQEVPYVDGDSDVVLADADGRDGVLADTGNAATTAMGRLDVTGDGTPEVVFVSNSKLYYVTADGTVELLRDRQGRELPASSGPGVA
jgi:hypothetical protein